NTTLPRWGSRVRIPSSAPFITWRHSQVVRPRTANPLPPVQIRLPPLKNLIYMPVWRNWQTRGTQNPVSVEDVPVRSRPLVSESLYTYNISLMKVIELTLWVFFCAFRYV